MEKLVINNVFVLHVKKGYEERAKSIETQFTQHQIPFEYILDGDLTDLTSEIIEKYFSGQEMTIHKAFTSCAFKHILAYEKMIQEKMDYALIFEDDIVLSANFNAVFNQSIKEIQQKEEKGIFVSYEDTTLEFVPKKELKQEKLLYPAKKGRCAGSYLIDYQTAKIMLNYIYEYKCHLPIDWLHNFLLDKNLFSMYWCHPTIAQQGSHTGKFTSGLSTKQGTLVQQIRWKAKAFWKKIVKN